MSIDHAISKVRSCVRAVAVLMLLVLFCFAVISDVSGRAGIAGSDGYVWAETNTGDRIDVDVTGKKKGYSAVLYNNMNGLPTSEANAITETSEGFIWIGSYSGLIRYDGNTFERMDSTTGIASVRSLFVDSRERLWIGTNDSGIFVMEKGEFTRFDSDEDLKAAAVRSFAEDENGNIYAATTAGIIVIDSSMQAERIHDEHIEDSYVTDLQMSSDGTIYGIMVNGEAFTLRDGRLDQYYDVDRLGGIIVVSILPDDDNAGKVWIGTPESEILYGSLDDSGRMSRIDASPLMNIKSIERYGNQLWICSDNGIGIYKGKKVTVLDNVPMDHSVDHVITDYAGNLWFTSSRQGVMKIVPNRFEDIFERFGLDKTVVNSTCVFREKLFIGTDDGLIVTDSKEKMNKLPLKSAATASGKELDYKDFIQMMEGCRIRSILPDSKGNIWLATFSERGLVRYDGRNATVFTSKDGLPSEWVRATYEREDGTMLVALTGGVAVIDGDDVKKVYGDKDGLQNTEILTVMEAVNGDIIAGSDGGGIYIINDNGTKCISTRDGLSSNVIMRVKKDAARDIYWIVTSNAIAYMDDQYNVKVVSSFPYSNNFDLYQNKNDEMWVISSNGLYEVTTDEMLADKDISPVFYGVDNGLPAIATGNSYSGLTEDGDLYIACSSGTVKVNIDEAFEDVSNLKMAVPYVKADDTMIYPDDKGEITIPAGTRKLTVYSYVFNYSLTNPLVTYQLEGFENKSTTVKRSDLVPVDYTNLRGGTYHYIMQLSDSMGHGNKEVSVKILKTKAFYEQLWFMVLAVLLAFMLIALAVKKYIDAKTRALEKKHQEARRVFEQTAEALASAIDAKDTYTNGHSRRVAAYSLKIAKQAGKSEEVCDKVYFAALLHDVGKIGVPIEILSKKGRLTDDEFEQIKFHPVAGGNILENIKESPWLSLGARYHHERYNGTGYPEGLKGEAIPDIARIIAVADAYDAMTSNRSYRKAIPQHIVREEIVKGIGTQFDPEYAKIMIHMIDLDTEYKMQESQSGDNMRKTESLRCESIYNKCTEGIGITNKITRIRLCSHPDEGVPADQSLPSLILFDSLDGTVHPGEENNKDIIYFEYGRIRLDGKITEEGVRKTRVRVLDETTVKRSEFGEPLTEQLYAVEAIRYKDKAMIRIADEVKTTEIVIALPDSARFLYISIGGEKCFVHNIMVDTDKEELDGDYIPRIAEEISYIKGCPTGEVANVEVNGWCSEATTGIPLLDGMKLTFHSLSLPTARLVWHCPYIRLFSSEDGQVKSKNFREYMLLRIDGENWESDEHVKNKVQVNRTEAFTNWENWKEKNKEGLDCAVIITRDKDVIKMHTENLGIAIDSETTIIDKVEEIYVAITGDQVAITDVHAER